ncbi:hypothetical protein N0V86_008203 [Didymella sp. IMI 355093]|nr:hypothetical protein N0V86_008203 [Didymella sp. IMI 355093]
MSASPDHDPSLIYNRDAIVASMTRYYSLLSLMVGIKPTDIELAPPSGRNDDDIPLETVRLLGFNDRMIDFIRHAPFVGSADRPVYYSTQTLNYYRSLFAHSEKEYMLNDPHAVEMWPFPEQRIPEGIVPLSRFLQGDDRGTWWLLDTNTGQLTAHGPYLERPSYEVPEDEQWRSARPVPATAYFDGLHADLLALRIVPLPGTPRDTAWDMWPTEGMRDRQRWADEAKQIYLSYHWPTLKYFQRAKCRRLLVEMLERCRAWDREKWAKRPPPVAYEDVSGSPIIMPHGG